MMHDLPEGQTQHDQKTDGAESLSTAGLGLVLDNGITAEEHLLYLASPESHTKLRNAKLPRGCGMREVRTLENRGLLSSHSTPPDAHGSIVEYLITFKGVDRLRELRSKRPNAEFRPTHAASSREVAPGTQG